MSEQPLLFSEEEMRKPAGDDIWQALRQRALTCTQCGLCHTRKQVVFGLGNIKRPDLCLIGEAPGTADDMAGKPFTGGAGSLLQKILGAMHIKMDDVYLANLVNCKPPGSRKPTPEEVHACSGWIVSQIRAIQPKIIVTLGLEAANFILDLEEENLTKIRGRWGDWQGIPVMPTFSLPHLVLNPIDKSKAWGDLQEVVKKLGRSL